MAFISIWPVLRLLNQDTKVDEDNTYTVPLRLCLPASFDIDYSDGNVITTEADMDDGMDCKDMAVLIFATISSLCISAIACLLFAYKIFRNKPKKGTVNLIFVLLQSGLVTGALLAEMNFWKDGYAVILDSSGFGNDLKVRFHGAKWVIELTCALQFITLLVLVMKKLVAFFCSSDIEQPTATADTSDKNLSYSSNDDFMPPKPASPKKSWWKRDGGDRASNANNPSVAVQGTGTSNNPEVDYGF